MRRLIFLFFPFLAICFVNMSVPEYSTSSFGIERALRNKLDKSINTTFTLQHFKLHSKTKSRTNDII